MEKDVYVVPHSHWDAEWYFTCEDSHILLVENLDYLIDLLEKDNEFQSYSFDGLSIIIDEYLEVRPEQKERLKSLIKKRKLFVGPWYTQTDSLLVRSESVVRNLVYGVQKAKSFGHNMDIGYLPDIFGQHTYLPSFFQDLGIHYSVLQRGVYTEQIKDNLNFYWRSPNMKMIPTNCLYFGYGPGKFISSEQNYLNYRLLPILNQLSEMNKNTNQLLLPSGGDQVLANKEFPNIVKSLNELNLGYKFKMSNYEDYMNDVWNKTEFNNIIDGELYACQKSRMHRTCHSTRMDIKQQTHITEHLLLDHLEPLLCIARSLNMDYPKVQMSELWKKVFSSHAHNGIEASNADQVNANVKNRLASVERSAKSLINLYKKKISKMISNKLGKKNLIIVFNCDIHNLNNTIDAVLFTKSKNFSLIHSLSNEEIPFVIKQQDEILGGQNVIVTAAGEKLESVANYYRSEIMIEINEVNALGYDTYYIEEKVSCDDRLVLNKENSIIENEYFSISLEENQLILKQKILNKEIKNFIEFNECCDDGDEFDFAPLMNDVAIKENKFYLKEIKSTSLFECMVVESRLHLPLNKEERIVANYSQYVIETTFELRKGEKMLRVTHNIDNNSVEHRLRVHIKTDIEKCLHSYADQGYSIIERESTNKYLENWRELGFVEKPMPIYTMENTAYVKGNDYNMGFITKGIKEYEVINEEKAIALTLFRSVGLLGKDDTPWRPGRASGINNKIVHTPDALMLCEMKFEYAIVMDQFEDSQIFERIQQFREHYLTYQVQTLNTFEERLERFTIPLSEKEIANKYNLLNIDNHSVFMSMCKDGNEEDEMHIRLFNPTNQTQEVTLFGSGLNMIYDITILEEKKEMINNTFNINAKDYKNICVKIKRIGDI